MIREESAFEYILKIHFLMSDEDYSDGTYYTWPPFPDENKIDLVNNSSSSNLEVDYISKSLSEFSINPQQ